MKKLLLFFLFLVISLAARSQAIQFTASVPHTNGTPSGTPSAQGSRLRYDKTNQILYQWTGSTWTRVVGVITDGDKGDLTVSSSGTSWQLDAGSVGNAEIASGAGGMYKGNGTIPGTTFAEITDEFSIGNAGTSHFSVLGSGAYLYSPFGTATKEAGCANDGAFLAQGDVGKINVGDDGMKVTDYRATPRGLQYVSDYSATYNDRSLPDWGSVKAMVSDSIATVGGDGNGIYSGSGTVPSGTVATVSRFALRTTTSGYRASVRLDSLVNSTTAVDFYSPGALLLSNGVSGNHSYIQFSDSTGHLRVGSVSGDPFYGYFTFQNGTSTYTDGSEEGIGLCYTADYSSTIAANDRSIPDVGTVKGLVFGSVATGLTATATLNFPSTAAATCSDLTISVSGAADGNPVSIGVPGASVLANGSYSAWVSASNTVTVRFCNHRAAGALDPASGTFRATVANY